MRGLSQAHEQSGRTETRTARRRTHRGWAPLVVTALTAMLAVGCGASRAYRQGTIAMRDGDLDQAVAYYRTASAASPDNPNYRIALQRASLAASRAHFEKAREFEERNQLEAARGEYQLAAEYDATNQQARAKVTSLDQVIRGRIEAARPKPAIEQLRARARTATQEPILNPASRDPISMRFTQVNIRDILDSLGGSSGISIVYDPAVPQAPTSVNLTNVTFEQAMQQIMSVNALAYKVLNERAILVFPDNNQKHQQYDEQVVQTFYVSHADVQELGQTISQLIRIPGLAVPPIIQPNKTNNTITVRGTVNVVQIIEKIIRQNDKARAEIVVDVEILEVNRTRAKQYGLNLSEYALGAVLSPEVAPTGTVTTGENGATAGRGVSPSQLGSPPPFNLNTISRGVSTTDFWTAVPSALVRFLESDTSTKLIAKPQLRGAEGSRLALNLGDSIPVVQTSYTPIAQGGATVNPLSSYVYRDVGVNIDMTPRVTADGDIILDLVLDNSSLGANVNVAGVSVPSFGQRKLTTRLRLRDGESNLLAGLLREDDRKALTGFPGAVSVPILRDLFSSNDKTISQTDIVMLLTPHIIRTMEITEDDLKPIYIGSQGTLGIGGPPPFIAPAAEPEPPAAAPQPPPNSTPVPGGVIMPPPGTSPVPGTIFVPTPPPTTTPPPGASLTNPEPGSTVATAAAASTSVATTAPPAPATPDVIATPGVGSAQIIVTPSSPVFRVGEGPYTVPISISNAVRVSTVTLTLTFDAAVLRVRSVNEGSFMRSGGATATFAHQASPGRIDFTITRSSDAVGATGTGLLGSVMFDAIAPGNTTLGVSGAATGPGGTGMGLQFRPVSVAVQP